MSDFSFLFWGGFAIIMVGALGLLSGFFASAFEIITDEKSFETILFFLTISMAGAFIMFNAQQREATKCFERMSNHLNDIRKGLE